MMRGGVAPVRECGGAWFPEAVRCSTTSDDCLFDSDCRERWDFCDYDELLEFFTCEALSTSE